MVLSLQVFGQRNWSLAKTRLQNKNRETSPLGFFFSPLTLNFRVFLFLLAFRQSYHRLRDVCFRLGLAGMNNTEKIEETWVRIICNRIKPKQNNPDLIELQGNTKSWPAHVNLHRSYISNCNFTDFAPVFM